MGTRRKKAGAGEVAGTPAVDMERAIYNIFGEVIGQTDEPAREARPVPPPPPPQPPAPAPTAAGGTDVASISPYQEREYFDPSNLSAEMQTLYKDSYDAFERAWRDGRPGEKDRIVLKARQMGLDMNNPEDRKIYADLVSFFPDSGTWDPPLEVRQALRKQNEQQLIARQMTIPDTGPLRYTIQPSRHVDADNPYYPDLIRVNNHSFFLTPNAPSGIGYMMVARQVAAAREIARRTGKNVQINVHAVSQGGLNGFAVWPKLGYVFDIPDNIRQKLIRRGFPEDVLMNTAVLMTSRSSKGETGFDAWGKVVPKNSDGYGKTMITPESARGTGSASPAEAVLRAYGKRRGFVKRQRSGGDDFLFTSEDNAILRDVWSSLTKQKEQR